MNQFTSMDQIFTTRIDNIILANLENESFGAKELVRETGMSRFNLNRKLRFISRKTINPYIREVRLKRAMEMLLQDSVTASEAGFRVGFSSPAYFSTCFSEYFGYPPGEVKKRGLKSQVDSGKGFSGKPGAENQETIKSGNKPPKSGIPIWGQILFGSIVILLIIAFIYLLDHKDIVRLISSSDNRLKAGSRSIAVLPFINDSKDPENVYFINGVMEAILDNLSGIKELEVHPRTSVEQYRNNSTKTIPQIARELGVNYIIEGSGQKIGDQVSICIQLIEASSDKHLFSNRYNLKLGNIFDLQSDVASKIASEIKTIAAIEEKESIYARSTDYLFAHNLFLQANDLYYIAESEGKWELNIKAEHLYKRSIRLDSTYAEPYVSLGWIISNRNIDSALYLANRALHFDNKNPEAYILKGSIYAGQGMVKEAEKTYKLSIKYKPDNSSAFRSLGDLYFYQGKCYSAFLNHLQAFHLENNSMQERNNVESICFDLYSLGFYKEGEKYAERLFELNNDSSYYYWNLATAYLDLGKYKSAYKSALKMYGCNTKDPNNIYRLLYTCLYLRDFREAEKLLQQYLAIMKQQGRKIVPDYLFGFVYLENGMKKEADFHFEGTIKEMSKLIALNEPTVSCYANMVLTKIYSARNENAKAMACLKNVKNSMHLSIFRIKDFKNCTMLDNIRHEPGFEEFLKEAEARYKKEHDNVEQLLRKEGILASLL